jgi:hypothetical protein
MKVASFLVKGMKGHPTLGGVGDQVLVDALSESGPGSDAKFALLRAVNLCCHLLGERGPYGPPLQGMTHVPMRPEAVGSDGQTPVSIAVEVLTAPAELALCGFTPAVLALDKIAVELQLTWQPFEGMSPLLSFERFQVSDGKNFAREQIGHNEFNDVDMAANVVSAAMGKLLEAARSRAAVPTETVPLGKAEREVLELVAEYAFNHVEATPVAHVELRSNVSRKEVATSIDSLVLKGLVVPPSAGHLRLSPKGLLACHRSGDVVSCAESFVALLVRRTREEGTAFAYAALDDVLYSCNLRPERGFAFFVDAVVRTFCLSPGDFGCWAVPEDILDLRSASSVQDLVLRAEKIRKEEARRAEAQAGAECADHGDDAAASPVINIVYKIFGSVGAIQSGSGNRATVERSTGAGRFMRKAVHEVRAALKKFKGA